MRLWVIEINLLLCTLDTHSLPPLKRSHSGEEERLLQLFKKYAQINGVQLFSYYFFYRVLIFYFF